MIFMTFIITYTTYDAVFDTFGLKAYKIENLTDMIATLTAFWILELLYFCLTHFGLNIFYKRYFNFVFIIFYYIKT